jgi:NhaP-type Na+/H+ or K+/H+ antiporter
MLLENSFDMMIKYTFITGILIGCLIGLLLGVLLISYYKQDE